MKRFVVITTILLTSAPWATGQETPQAYGAEKAGLRGFSRARNGTIISGDLIQKIDDQPVATPDDLLTILEKHKPGDTVSVTYLREDEVRTTRVQLQRPSR